MPRLPFLFLLLLLAALPGCEMFSSDEGEVSARVIGDSVFVTNNTEARIYYFIVGREAANLIDWIPRLDVEKSVTPGKTIRLDRKEDILGSSDEKEAIVHWWHAVEREPGLVQSFVIKL